MNIFHFYRKKINISQTFKFPIRLHSKIFGNVELQNKYDNLKVAGSLISLSKKDVSLAKAKLTTMMNTIDRCVEKINDDSHE